MNAPSNRLIPLAVSALLLNSACAPSTPGTVAPSAKPSSAATPAPSATPAPLGAPGATATPTPIPTNADTSQRATINGVVFDLAGNRVSGATVIGKVLGGGTFANGSDTLTTTTQVGSYALNGTPTGETLLITVSLGGHTLRQQTIVPLANLTGDPSANKLDFGLTNSFGISTGIDVVQIQGPSGSDTESTTDIVLGFSEPVNPADAEASFAVYVAGPFATAGMPNASEAYTLSALDDGGQPIKLPYAFDTAHDDGITLVDQITPNASTHFLYDHNAFTASWSPDNRVVTFSFKPGHRLPTDKNPDHAPTYAISFQGKSVRDASGTDRGTPHFTVSIVQPNRVGYAFQVAADTTPPAITAVTGLNETDSGSGSDRIRIQYSEPMHLFPANFGGKAIPGLGASSSATRNANYRYAVQNTLSGDNDADLLTTTSGTAGSLLADDPSNRTVTLVPSSDDPAASTGLTGGSTIWVKADTAITDPAGNTVDGTKSLRSGRAL